MQWVFVMAGALAIAASAVPARAAVSDCPVPPATVQVALPSGLLAALRHALPDGIALPGKPFDTTDVYVKGYKHRRYIIARSIGCRTEGFRSQGKMPAEPESL